MNREELQTSIEELGILYKLNKDQFSEYVKVALDMWICLNEKMK